MNEGMAQVLKVYVVVVSACIAGGATLLGCKSSTRDKLPWSCPVRGGRIAKDVWRYGAQFPVRWVEPATRNVFETDLQSVKPRLLGPLRTFQSTAWDDLAWYRMACPSSVDCFNPDARSAFGALERVDRATGKSTVLAADTSSVGDPLVLDGYVYWALADDESKDRSVYRVGEAGGGVERFDTPAGNDQVRRLVGYSQRGVLVERQAAVDWLPLSGDSPRTLLQSAVVGAASLDDNEVYVADLGRLRPDDREPFRGRIVRVALHGGEIRELATGLDKPVVIAIHGDRVFYMLYKSGDIWSVSKAGEDPPRRALAGAAYAPSEQSLELWAHPCGLVWVHGDGRYPLENAIEFAPWASLEWRR